MPSHPSTDFEQQLVEQRSYLMRFARLQLRNDAWAEDAVSETLLAALAKPQAFEARSQLKTWLVGILKHKIIDAMRQRQREVGRRLVDPDPANRLRKDVLVGELQAAVGPRTPIVTEVAPVHNFHVAEEEHHRYFERHPYQGYCAMVVAPKVESFRQAAQQLLKGPGV